MLQNIKNISDGPVHKLKPKVGIKHKLLVSICGLFKHRVPNDGILNYFGLHHFVFNALAGRPIPVTIMFIHIFGH